MIEIRIDRTKLIASVDLVGDQEHRFGSDEGARHLASRPSRDDLRPHPQLPDDTRLWAALVEASGGIWAGCVYDVDAIAARLAGDNAAVAKQPMVGELKEQT